MTTPTLFYSRAKLVRLGLISALIGFGCLPIGWRMTGKEGLDKLHEAYVFYAFGANGPSFFLLIFGLLFGLAGLTALARAAGDRAAATIRIDGLGIFGLLRSTVIPWRYLEAVSLNKTRFNNKDHYTLILRSGRRPGQSWLSHRLTRRHVIPASRLDAMPAELASWGRAAEAGRRRALLQPPSPPARLAAGTFGRRV